MTSFHPLSIAALLACSCVAIACGGDSAGKPGGSECALLAAYEDRLTALEGPLGCTSTETLTPDPPGGCEGAKQLVMEMRANLAANLEENGCSSEPPDLTALVADYEARFAAENPFTEHTVERDGFAIAAREYGVQHAGDSPTIVFMHGLPDSQTLYDLVAPALGETHHTVTFDFVGWGRSESPSDPATLSFDGLRRDLEAVLDYFSPIQVVPVVHDLSSWPGIDWALDNPESVRTLVILNATYHPVTGTQPPYVIRALMAADVRP